MNIGAVLSILATHFLADFVCQNDWMAISKSKRWDALALHVGIYTACFSWALPLAGGLGFVALTFATHFTQDAVTSRINARLWRANERHLFFVGIGADQLLHYVILLLSWRWLIQ